MKDILVACNEVVSSYEYFSLYFMKNSIAIAIAKTALQLKGLSGSMVI